MGSPHWWEHHRFGMLVNTSLASVPGWAPVGQSAECYRAHIDGESADVLLHPSPMVETLAHHRDRWGHVERYDDFLPFLTYDDFDPDAWSGLARAAGMTYAIMVAKHHDGLCWWDAPKSEHTVVYDGPARNVLGEFATACERADLVFGTHYSLLDWHDPRYPSAHYVDEVLHPHVLDLVERYGSRLLWGDGHWGRGGEHWRSDELIAAARRIDPDLVVNDRWWSDGPSVRTFEHRVPDGITPGLWEARLGLGPSFAFNRAERAEHVMSPNGVVALLTEVVAKGGRLLLSVGPDASGCIPDAHVASLQAAGQWVRTHRDLVTRGVPWTEWGDERSRYLVLDEVVHAVDVDGSGRFDALRRGAGRVRAVEAVGDASRRVDFDQTDEGLRLATSRQRTHAEAGSLPIVYRVEFEPPAALPIELFPPARELPRRLQTAIGEARPGQIVQLGEGRYLGPAVVPDGVVVRGLGHHRTIIDGRDECAVTLEAGARLEHCDVRGGGNRIVWLPKVVVRLAGPRSAMLACHVDGHVDMAANEVRVTSCTATGVVSSEPIQRAVVARSTFRGMQWDCAIELNGGSGHVVESCDIADVLEGVRLSRTVGAVVRGNRVRARWWGVRLLDTEATVVAANTFDHTMRAVDVDGGTHADITGNAVNDGDSGCVVQRGASNTTVNGNRWERCRIGLIAWDAGYVHHRDNSAVDLDDAELTIGP